MKKILTIFAIVWIAGINACLAAPNSRYISLAPSATEILFALGLDEEIVGVSSYCNYPQGIRNKESVGNFSNPNIEKIISLKPDYIFCTGLEQAPVVTELKTLKLNVYVSDPSNIKELFDSIREIGKITDRTHQAESLIKGMQEEIAETTNKIKSVPLDKRQKVFVEIWHDPLTTAGKGSFIDEVVSLSGGINIAHNTRRPYSIFSAEGVIKQNPDAIIILYMDKTNSYKLIKERLGWESVSAVKNNRVYNDINPDILLRPGPRVVTGIKEVQKRLYP